jgi:hypothetical protein
MNFLVFWSRNPSDHIVIIQFFQFIFAPFDLALAQLAVLGMFDGLEQQVHPSAPLVKLMDLINAENYSAIEQRIFAMKSTRQALGLLLRSHVIKKFSGNRYLREHEQMLWTGQRMTKELKKIELSSFIHFK